MASRRIVALKRIANDMRELSKCPLEGIGIAPAEEDPTTSPHVRRLSDQASKDLDLSKPNDKFKISPSHLRRI